MAESSIRQPESVLVSVAEPCAPGAPEAVGLCAQRADAQDRVGIGAGQVQGLLDPVQCLDVAVSHLPVAAECRHHRDRVIAAGSPDRPCEGRVEVVDLGVQRG